MINLSRTHDFQVQLSPSQAFPAAVNPPSFNWPESIPEQQYSLQLKNISTGDEWNWEQVNSPLQLSHELPTGQYQWRLVTTSDTQTQQVSEWINFEITEELANYIAPSAKELFEFCEGREQWLMYFDEDIATIKAHSQDIYTKLKHTATLSAPLSDVTYPKHYQRGQEEGKREAIANVRNWIDRDLITHALLYKIWGEEEHGIEAINRLLQLAEWSPEGPASLLRPCTWGDEVGCSLARNLFLAYHWLSPLLNKNEKDLFIRPMLVRIARQIMERLEQDEFKQYPGHSHTSRLPAYLGLAGLALYREHNIEECEQWLNEAITIYRGILPFYGGIDGSWVEGSFYASTYSKWYHPLFLSIERLSGFSFYEHPFYQNFVKFAQDFIAPEQDSHPFSDGFWCTREGKEWPGFFSQNPLRIYAARFGDQVDYQQSQSLENAIEDYRLHLLDVVPTIKQIEYIKAVKNKKPDQQKQAEEQALSHYYPHAGLGKFIQQQMSLYYRASVFGNSSHRHADQGNIGFFDNNIGILAPTGSYGYRFGSKHHSQWTRQTIAHNLPLVDGQGQKLDDPSARAFVIDRRSETNYHLVTLNLSESYGESVLGFYRTIVLIKDIGLILVDSVMLSEDKPLNWRLHSPLNATLVDNDCRVLLTNSKAMIDSYQCRLLSHTDVQVNLEHGYEGELSIPERAIESDASKEVVHIEWLLPASKTHTVVASCIKDSLIAPEVRHLSDGSDSIELTVQGEIISIPLYPSRNSI
tara:strand:+ start:6252 stop:8507 length:2256 start_codon:yes stop_codon:yes gene_type:complete